MARSTIIRFSSSTFLLLVVSSAACASTEDIQHGPQVFGGAGPGGSAGSAGKGGKAGTSGFGGSGTGGFSATGGTGATGGSGATSTGGTSGAGGSGNVICKSDADCAPYTNKRCDPSIGQCVFCLPSDDDCPPGQYCTLVKTCAPGCKDDAECQGVPVSGDGGPAAGDAAASDSGPACATARCDTATRQCKGCCTDDNCPLGAICGLPSSDAGTAPGDSSTSEKSCVPGCSPTHGCPTGKACCTDNTCHDTQTDVNNCGACGTKCGNPANATGACAAGKCGVGMCTTGFGDCNMNPADGCEANLTNSAQNCGACGTMCNSTNGTARCNASKCEITCTTGFGNCDNNGANGCEADFNTSITACGGCGKRCGNFSAQPVCRNAVCEMNCQGSWRNCDNDPSDGCEELAIDRDNCGDCGKVCNPANTIGGVCNAPNCNYTRCSTGFNDCDGDKWNGCEKNGPC